MNYAAGVSSDMPVCAICLEQILPGATLSKLNCNHEYHRACLQTWLDFSHNTCPLDRGIITSIVQITNPLPLNQRSIRVIQNPSIHSADPLEREAAEVQSIFFSIFFDRSN